ncbi:Transcriptional regulator, GntR family [Clostridiaceae bacterium JG1575]|nr:Transcriptional regulator, GntR family [Clostridiaceae bacterium JG1575]
MELELNKGSGIPLYKQVRNAITEKIRQGELPEGYRMPTERELSDQLKISRNTVSSAYRDLEKEGLILSHQGKGTFVSMDSREILEDEGYDRILRFVDLGLDEALSTGMEAKAFLKLVENRVSEKIHRLRNASAVYVECNTEQARSFAKQLAEGTNLTCEALTLQDLEEMSDETRLTLYNARVVVSTFNHVPEVMEAIQGFGKTVLGVAIHPDLRTMIRIARLPLSTRFAFVCISLEFREKVRDALMGAGLSDLDVIYTNTANEQELQELLFARDVILVSPGRYRDVVKVAKDKEIIPLLYNLDDGSLKTLKQRLLELNIV